MALTDCIFNPPSFFLALYFEAAIKHFVTSTPISQNVPNPSFKKKLPKSSKVGGWGWFWGWKNGTGNCKNAHGNVPLPFHTQNSKPLLCFPNILHRK